MVWRSESGMEECEWYGGVRVVWRSASGMEECVSKASVQGQCTFLYNASEHCAIL